MAALLLACVWCGLLLGAALGAPLAVTYGACVAVLAATRPPRRPDEWGGACALAFGAGFVALPAWLAAAAFAGGALGWPPPRAPAPGGADWLAHVALAPLLEEWLYRERALPALRRRLGAPAALAASSALFAAPHLEAWSVLTAFGVGLALGALRLACGRVGPCVAAHAGLNAAALVCGLPPERLALPPAAAAALAGALSAFALAWTRGHDARRAASRAGPAEARPLQRCGACRSSAIRAASPRSPPPPSSR
jgi:membrane protease YdiL (CAAX protease family)